MNYPSSSCPTCGHRLGPKLLDCPYRADGGCPFEAAASPPGSKANSGCMVGVLLFVLMWLGLGVLAFGTILFGSRALSSSMLSLVGLGCFGAFGLLGIGFALFGLFGKNVLLFNPKTGVMARYATIFGRAFGGGVSSGWEALPPELSQLSLSEPLRYPPSWSAWLYTADNKNYGELATFICQTTLLALVAQKRLDLQKTTTRDTFFGLVNRQTQRYLFRPHPTSASPPVEGEGALEEKILSVFAAPPPRLQAEAWLPGTPLEATDLIAAIYDSDKTQPKKWLIEQVEADVVANGVGRKEKGAGVVGWLKSNVVIEPAHQKQLTAEYQRLSQIVEPLNLAQPDFMKTLRADIEKAFKARTESSD